MLLRLSSYSDEWVRLAAALEDADSHILANVVRSMLASAPRSAASEVVELAFTPQQAGALQQAGAALGLSLLATPVLDEPAAGGWVTAAAERAEAVAAADAIVRANQRRRVA